MRLARIAAKGWQPVLDLRLMPLALLSGALVGALGGLVARPSRRDSEDSKEEPSGPSVAIPTEFGLRRELGAPRHVLGQVTTRPSFRGLLDHRDDGPGQANERGTFETPRGETSLRLPERSTPFSSGPSRC